MQLILTVLTIVWNREIESARDRLKGQIALAD